MWSLQNPKIFLVPELGLSRASILRSLPSRFNRMIQSFPNFFSLSWCSYQIFLPVGKRTLWDNKKRFRRHVSPNAETQRSGLGSSLSEVGRRQFPDKSCPTVKRKDEAELGYWHQIGWHNFIWVESRLKLILLTVFISNLKSKDYRELFPERLESESFISILYL